MSRDSPWPPVGQEIGTRESEGVGLRLDVELVTKREGEDADDGEGRVETGFGDGHCLGHDRQPDRSNGARQQEAMLAPPAPERDRADDHGEAQSYFMDDMLAEHSARIRAA